MIRQHPRRLANLVYAWCIERVDPEKIEQWDSDLVDLLPWQDAQSEAAAEIESASFMAMASKGSAKGGR